MMIVGDTGRTKDLFTAIADKLGGAEWLSTQETAYSLIALAPYMSEANDAAPITVEAGLAGMKDSASFREPQYLKNFGNVSGTGGDYDLHNPGKTPVYAEISVRGVPKEGTEPALSNGVKLEAAYLDTNGNAINPDSAPIGTDIQLKVTVTNTSREDLANMALIVPCQSSMQINNYRDSASQYQDIRDDRVMTYFNLGQGDDVSFTFQLTKTFNGLFYKPAIRAYAMYDESIQAVIPGVPHGTGKG
jgi:uncharacterized protein YfaS (alpha-2-macroglobulin family)